MQEAIAALVLDRLAFKKGSNDKQQQKQRGCGKACETEALMKRVLEEVMRPIYEKTHKHTCLDLYLFVNLYIKIYELKLMASAIVMMASAVFFFFLHFYAYYFYSAYNTTQLY